MYTHIYKTIVICIHIHIYESLSNNVNSCEMHCCYMISNSVAIVWYNYKNLEGIVYYTPAYIICHVHYMQLTQMSSRNS